MELITKKQFKREIKALSKRYGFKFKREEGSNYHKFVYRGLSGMVVGRQRNL